MRAALYRIGHYLTVLRANNLVNSWVLLISWVERCRPVGRFIVLTVLIGLLLAASPGCNPLQNNTESLSKKEDESPEEGGPKRTVDGAEIVSSVCPSGSAAASGLASAAHEARHGTELQSSAGEEAESLETLTMWAPYREWEVTNPTWRGNPYDLEAWVTFTHEESKLVQRTQMFY
jgi:hypothetical protein